MPRTFRIALLFLIVTGLTTAGSARAQAPSAPAAPRSTPDTSPSGGPAAARGTGVSGLNDVVATITVGTQTDKVTRGELINFLSRYPIPDESHESVYREGI